VRTRFAPLIALALLVGSVLPAAGYDYPIEDPRVATIIGTPSAFRADLPARVPLEDDGVTVFPDRQVPPFFWYYRDLRFGLVAQSRRAPLVFVIAGTGAGHNSGKMLVLARILYQAGNHVVLLPSPTHPNFIVTASTTMVPGDLQQDAHDLYRVMELVWARLKDRYRVDASEFHLVGYSLGAAQAAVVSRLDEERRSFGFGRVLMINPPLSLYASTQVLDDMLISSIPGGAPGFPRFFNSMMADVTHVYATREAFDFSSDFFYRLYQERPDGPADDALRQQRLGAIIGISFRVASAGMFLTSDIMSRAGVLVPRAHELGRTTNTTPYASRAMRKSFDDYVREVFAPYYLPRRPGSTLESLIASSSLQSIEGYLRQSPKIGLVHNEDDIILAPGQIDQFRQMFGARARIYPRGGHCGNLEEREVAAYIASFFGR